MAKPQKGHVPITNSHRRNLRANSSRQSRPSFGLEGLPWSGSRLSEGPSCMACSGGKRRRRSASRRRGTRVVRGERIRTSGLLRQNLPRDRRPAGANGGDPLPTMRGTTDAMPPDATSRRRRRGPVRPGRCDRLEGPLESILPRARVGASAGGGTGMARAGLLLGIPARATATVALVAALSTGSPGEIRSSSPEGLRDLASAPGLLGDLLAGSFEPAAPSPGSSPAFVGIGRSLRIRVDGAGATLASGEARVRLSFPRGTAAAPIVPSGLLPGRSHHCRGSDRRRWRREVPRFAEVRSGDAAPGVAALFRFRGGDPEYEFAVAPGADAAAIEVAVE